MNDALRDTIGKAAHDAAHPLRLRYFAQYQSKWEEIGDELREIYMQIGEAAVEAYNRARPLRVSTVRIKSILDRNENADLVSDE